VIGTGCGGNSFPIVLAAVGRRYPQGSQKQRVAFGMVSSLGSLGQCCFLPIARAMIEAIGWRYSFITFGAIVVVSAPFAYFLRTVPPIPSEQPPKIEDEPTTILDMNSESTKEEKNTTEENHTKENNDVEKGILAVLKEAFSSPIFIMICIGFSVCGFHVSFLATHLPAYLVKEFLFEKKKKKKSGIIIDRNIHFFLYNL
jgi:MFS family permease